MGNTKKLLRNAMVSSKAKKRQQKKRMHSLIGEDQILDVDLAKDLKDKEECKTESKDNVVSLQRKVKKY